MFIDTCAFYILVALLAQEKKKKKKKTKKVENKHIISFVAKSWVKCILIYVQIDWWIILILLHKYNSTHTHKQSQKHMHMHKENHVHVHPTSLHNHMFTYIAIACVSANVFAGSNITDAFVYICLISSHLFLK